MSTFIHGGSALQLDIAGRAHAALTRGDVVQIDPAVGATDDGLSTRDVGNLNNCLDQVAPYGVVLGSNGKSTFAIGEDVLIRIMGVCQVNVQSTASGIGEGIQLRVSNNSVEGTGGTTYEGDAATVRVCGIAHTAGTGLQTVFFNGLSTWG
jgi:hypothetical protein